MEQKHVARYLAGEVSRDAMVEELIADISYLAKRQRTYFRRDPRIQWISWDPDPAVRLRTVTDYLDGNPAWNL